MSRNQMQIQMTVTRITKQNLTFIIRQAHGLLPAQIGTKIITNKAIVRMER